MESIHGHEVLNMMIESGEQYSNASLEAAITARFGERHVSTLVLRQI